MEDTEKYYKYEDEYNCFIVKYLGEGEGYNEFKGEVVKAIYGDYYEVGYYSGTWDDRFLTAVPDPFTESSIEVTEESTEEVILEKSSTEEDYKYYKYYYKGIKLDPYRILSIYNIRCPAQQHAIKKLLRAGNSIKELKQDIKEVIATLNRKLEMLEEDES